MTTPATLLHDIAWLRLRKEIGVETLTTTALPAIKERYGIEAETEAEALTALLALTE